MLLAIDTGNTDIVFGLFRNNQWIKEWRIPSIAAPSPNLWSYRLLSELLELDTKPSNIKQTVISSVVPDLTEPLRQMIMEVLGQPPIVLNENIYPKLKVTITNKEEIGTDLVANAVAAYDRYKQAAIVIDFGTALTFTTIDKDGKILGVAIAPGLKTAVNSLFTNTAQLPQVPLQVPESALGKDTLHAIQAGVLLGYTGMVQHLIQHIKTEIDQPCKVIATGGLSSILTNLEESFDEIDKKLTLNGLAIIGRDLT